MDKTIITLEQNQRGSMVDISGKPTYAVRRAARAVVSDSDGQIALLHARERDYYKLPGGGIDNDESIPAALARELMEEIGSAAEIVSELGQVVEWRDWDKLKQVSYCYKALLRGEKGTPEFTEAEIAEGFEIVWAKNMGEAIALVGKGTNSSDVHVSFMTKRDKAILESAKVSRVAPVIQV